MLNYAADEILKVNVLLKVCISIYVLNTRHVKLYWMRGPLMAPLSVNMNPMEYQ